MTDPSPVENAAVLAAVIAAIAAVIAAFVAAGAAVYNGRRQRKHEARLEQITRSHGERDYRVRQLNELYGPLYMMRDQSNRLREQLPDRPWRLVDHIEDIQRDPSDPQRPIVDSIVELNTAIGALITGKAGLLYGFPPPASFGMFLEHAELLSSYWDMGRNQDVENRRPFPMAFDEDIRIAIDQIVAELARLNADT